MCSARLVDDDIPLNAGCLKPLNVIIPEGSMLNPRYPAAVVSGNVETSSCITNALYGALGVLASAPGTMNNFTFGNDRYQYYETISGGSGAGNGFDGTDVVQTHMTNSRLTDPEILEWRYPVRLESYEISAGSGGRGRWRGGNGGVRKIRFLEPMTASILSNNRIVPPFGAGRRRAGPLRPQLRAAQRRQPRRTGLRRQHRDAAGRRVRHRNAGRRRLRRGGGALRCARAGGHRLGRPRFAGGPRCTGQGGMVKWSGNAAQTGRRPLSHNQTRSIPYGRHR